MYSEPVQHPVNPVAAAFGGGASGAHHSFLASVIAHLLGAAGVAPHSNFLEPRNSAPVTQPGIHYFGPGGAGTYDPGPAGAEHPSLPAPVVPGLPDVPPGTYMGNYAAQGLRTSDPVAAAQLWEHRHPGAVQHGQVPGWVAQALLAAVRAHMPQQAAPAPVPSFQAQ